MNKSSDSASLHEIFSSIQGEGPMMGTWQIFVRFRGCGLKCASCDTKGSWAPSGEPFNMFISKYQNRPRQVPNPVSVQTLNQIVSDLDHPAGFHSHLVITGGEPLEQSAFLQNWLPGIAKKYKIYLETNAVHHEQVKYIYKFINYVSMDYKLPSFTGGTRYDQQHLQFFRIMRNVPGCIKIVVTPGTRSHEIEKAGKIIQCTKWSGPVIIQPVREFLGSDDVTMIDKTRQLSVIMKNFVADVRCIPRHHPDWNIR